LDGTFEITRRDAVLKIFSLKLEFKMREANLRKRN